MKVLMVAPEPFFEPRGTPISVYQRLTMLSSLRHEVDLATYHVGEPVSIEGVNVRRVVPIPWITHVPIGPSFAKIFLDIILFIQVIYLLFRFRYDVIHSHEEASFFCAPLAKIFRIPHVYDMHSRLPEQLSASKYGKFMPAVWLFRVLERSVLGASQAVLTVDRNLETHVLNAGTELVHARIENLPVQCGLPRLTDTGYPESYFPRDEGDEIPIVYTGTFESYQGLDLLIEAAHHVLTRFPKAHFILVGGTVEQIATYRNQAERLGISERISFPGTVSIEESIKYLDLAEVLVSPRTDGTAIPLKVYSYLKAGKAVVATSLPSHTQVFNSETAVLTDPSVDGLATGILQLLVDKPLRKALAANAMALAEQKYSLPAQAAKLDQVYRGVVVHRTNSRRANQSIAASTTTQQAYRTRS